MKVYTERLHTYGIADMKVHTRTGCSVYTPLFVLARVRSQRQQSILYEFLG